MFQQQEGLRCQEARALPGLAELLDKVLSAHPCEHIHTYEQTRDDSILGKVLVLPEQDSEPMLKKIWE